MNSSASPPRWMILSNFLCIYIVWGTTYLAIKNGISSIPPLFMASTRFLIAGPLLLAVGKVRRESFLQKSELKFAAPSGMMLVLANALVGVAEQWIPSGSAAMIVGTIPLWILLLNWLCFGGKRPTMRQLFGISMALVGIALLTRPQEESQARGSLLGVFFLIIAVISWSVGTLVQRRSGKLNNVFTFTGIQVLCGGIFALVLAFIFEGWSAIHPSQITSRSLFALAYLVVVGSVVGFSTYVWLNRHATAARVSTYALVNPVVAVWLGWLWGNEKLSSGLLSYTLLILAGLYLVIFEKAEKTHNA